jgi:glycosyltransferase 2 family protein
VEQLIRAWKWRQILWPLRAISTLRLFGAIMAGYLLATIIPFGFGTIARAWLVAHRGNLKVTAVLASVALDRLTDGLVFVCLVPIAVLGTTFDDPSGAIRTGLAWGGASSLVLFVLLILGLEYYRRQTTSPGPLLKRIGNRLPSFVGEPVRRLAASFGEGINWPQDRWRGVGIAVASLAMKLLAAGQLLAAGLMFDVALHPAQYLFVMVFLGFLVILGHFLRLAGGFIIGAVFALRLLGVPDDEALAIALVIQAANVLSVAGVGALALSAQGIALPEVAKAKNARY